MKNLVLLLLILISLNSYAENAGGNMQDKQKLILVKQQTNNSSIVVGLKAVPDFFEGTIENYCLELANKLSNNSSVLVFRPLKTGKAYTVASLNSGFISFQPFGDENGMDTSRVLEEFIKAN